MRLRVFTAFSGYDSQCLALERVAERHTDFSFDLVGWSEIDKHAIMAHNAIFPQWAGRNYGDISEIDWAQVPDFDLFTYSFPCTNISNAGKQEGFTEGSGTSSALLWECRRAIEAKRPGFLILENVKALTSNKFKPLFQKWIDMLKEYGYVSFWKVVNAKDQGVPQNRERVFLVSFLQPQPFKFPDSMPLLTKLRDVLEESVDEKYFLPQDKVDSFLERCDQNGLLGGEK